MRAARSVPLTDEDGAGEIPNQPNQNVINLAWGKNPRDAGTPVTTKGVTLHDFTKRLATHDERHAKMGAYICCPMSGSSRNGSDAQPWRLLCLDFDGKEGSKPDPDQSRAFFAKWYHFGYTTHSYTPENGKHRVVLLLDREVSPDEYRELFEAIASILPYEPDPKLNHPDQPVLLPSCPPGADRSSWVNEGEPFKVDEFLEGHRAQRKAESRAEAAWKPATESVIGAFNAAHSLTEILVTNGYRRVGKKYLHPNSESGIPGLSILRDGRLCFSHANDLLGDGKPHDAFDCWRILEGKGTHAEAVKEAARLLGMDWKPNDHSDDQGQHQGSGAERDDGWETPKAFGANLSREQYPVEALPKTIRSAVIEVQGFVKAPIPLVASSALTAVSLAVQSHTDVRRAERLTGPSGLFLLTIADSGERKTTCDGLFMSAVRAYDEEQAQISEPIVREYGASMDAWEAKRNGIKEKIRQLAKEGKDSSKFDDALSSHSKQKPEAPRVPRLVYGDATPEALAHNLAKQWPSAGIVSSEAGIVFGSHGMGKDSVMRNLAQLNVLWDGGDLSIDRRTSDSFTVRGARLTVGLQIQEPTLRDFFGKSGTLARGTGFLARFLLSWPESTQGARLFTDPPQSWPGLSAFHARIASILRRSAPLTDRGELQPAVMDLSPEAKAAWVEFHDAVERELVSGGELFDVRDVASKTAENAARLAVLFEMFEGDSHSVSAKSFNRASCIALWHLSESRRFFGELAIPQVFTDAMRLDDWLIGECTRRRVTAIPSREAQQFGPVRDHGRLHNAVSELDDLSRARLLKDGKRKLIEVNPALLEGAR